MILSLSSVEVVSDNRVVLHRPRSGELLDVLRRSEREFQELSQVIDLGRSQTDLKTGPQFLFDPYGAQAGIPKGQGFNDLDSFWWNCVLKPRWQIRATFS
jgi:hypothetical protein